MGCAACVARVEKAIKGVKGVESCAVSLASNSAQVVYDSAVTGPKELKKAVSDAGYELITEGADEDDDSDRRKGRGEARSAGVADGSDTHRAGCPGGSEVCGEGSEDGNVETTDDPDERAERLAERIREREWRALRRDAAAALVLAALTMGVSMLAPEFTLKGWLLFALAAPAVFWCGRRFIVSAWKQLRHGATGMDTLVALSIIISFTFSTFNLIAPQVWTSRGLSADLYFESSAMIVAFILLGRTLEEKAKRATGASVRELMDLEPKAIDIRKGDIFTVKPGERIGADGIVTEGESYVDESMLTGEPVPNFKHQGDKVYAGTVNQHGALEVRAEKVGRDTMLSAIIRMVKDAQGSKAKIQNVVDRVASVFVPVIIGIAIAALLAWIIFSPGGGLTHGLLAMVTVLVIACPCSLGLATPTAIIAGIGNGARRGILIGDADSLQTARTVDTVVLDKTGTLTLGRPKVLEAIWHTSDPARAAGILLAMESRSEHPLAGALTQWLQSSGFAEPEPFGPEKVESIPGSGVRALFDGAEYFAGNYAAVRDEDAERWRAEGKTVVFFSRGSLLLGVFAIADELKPGAADAVQELHRMGVRTCLLTGDNELSALAIASQAGIDEVRAEVLPDGKAQYIRELQASGRKVAMVGDGINDSAALACADLSIAMGTGSDIAIDTAMVTIVSGDLSKVPQLIRLSRRTTRIIRENLFWAFFYNILAVPVAAGALYPAFGFLLSPMIGAACMALSSVCVVCNSLRLRRG